MLGEGIDRNATCWPKAARAGNWAPQSAGPHLPVSVPPAAVPLAVLHRGMCAGGEGPPFLLILQRNPGLAEELPPN